MTDPRGETGLQEKQRGKNLKIDSSTVGMESARSYQTSSVSIRRFDVKEYVGAFQKSYSEAGANGANIGTEAGNSGEMISEENTAESGSNVLSMKDLLEQMQSVRNNYKIRSAEEQNAETIRMETIRYIFEQLFEARRKQLMDYASAQPMMNPDPAAMMNQKVSVMNYVEESYYSETENTSFSTTGVVKCADGREISFNVNVEMSRSFESYRKEELGLSAIQLLDPLVINLDSDVAEVSDQSFFFDLDADGEEEEISQLGSGSGFLALDRDGNGHIDDGSELFGTRSGDGFGDLARYDEDGNGWIDENDRIFEKLKIWCKAADGSDRLYTLAQAGVGAICLLRTGTEHAIKSESGTTQAVIRNTGVFLYENGQAGTLQHVDMAKFA